MLMERKLGSERQRQLEAVKQHLQAAHESLDKTKAELVAVRMERNDTVWHGMRLFVVGFLCRLAGPDCDAHF